jgi:regulatory protein YycH of two-component signal transduction system YycFG
MLYGSNPKQAMLGLLTVGSLLLLPWMIWTKQLNLSSA